MDFISNPNLPNILLKAERRDNLIAIQTYDRAHGRKGRFLICMDALQAWLDGDRERLFYDSDCGNFLVLRLYGGFCKMQLFWLSEYGSGDLHGIRQEVEIPEDQLELTAQMPQVDGAPFKDVFRDMMRQQFPSGKKKEK